MNTLRQTPVREVGARNRVGNDGVYRDIIQPFNCQRNDYLNCCRFSNTIEKQHGIKPSAISVLANGNKGFRLSMTSGSGAEYEVEVRDGMAKLGQVRSHQPRLLLASGSASAEATWTRFVEVVKEKEPANS